MRNYEIWPVDTVTIRNQFENKKSRINQDKTIKLIDRIGGLKGNVLDIGSRNLFTEILEVKYKIDIDSTFGDLDLEFNCPKKEYNFVHYNNVIEHQFNPLFTLLKIKKVLKDDGYLILGCPLKPKWITTATCHFHEFDEKAYKEIIDRADFKEIVRVTFYYQISLKSLTGIRPFLSSFWRRQMLSVLQKKN